MSPLRLLILVALCATTLSLRAEEAEPADGPPRRGGPPAKPFFIQLRYTPSALARADIKDDGGEVSKRQHDVTGTLMIPVQRGTGRINLAVTRDHHQYRFRDNPELAGFMEDAYSTQGAVVYMGPIHEEWSIFAMGSMRWTGEKGAGTSSSRAETGQIMVQRPFSERLQLGVGAMLSSRLDESNLFIPTASISWSITDRLALRTTRGLHLVYHVDEARKWQVGLNAEYLSRYYRLNDEGPAPNGVFRSRLVVTSLSMLYRPNPGVSIGAEIGVVPWRDLTVKDADRNTVYNFKVDTGFSGTISAAMTF